MERDGKGKGKRKRKGKGKKNSKQVCVILSTLLSEMNCRGKIIKSNKIAC